MLCLHLGRFLDMLKAEIIHQSERSLGKTKEIVKDHLFEGGWNAQGGQSVRVHRLCTLSPIPLLMYSQGYET